MITNHSLTNYQGSFHSILMSENYDHKYIWEFDNIIIYSIFIPTSDIRIKFLGFFDNFSVFLNHKRLFVDLN